jgi:parallel beta-helix repeat protein
MSLRRFVTKYNLWSAALALCGLVGYAAVPGNHAAAAASACSYYAAPSGSDSSNGSAGSPFATVTKLVTSLSAGQVGCLAAGATFTGDVSIYHGGSANAPITITSADLAHPATIKGRLTTFSGADWMTFSQLRLDGVNSSGLPSPTVGSEHVTFSHVDVTNDHTAICFDLINSSQWGVARFTTVDASRIHDCGRLPFGSTNNDHGIYISGFNTTVTNNYIYDNTDRGVQLRGAQSSVVRHNVIDGNGEGVIFGDLSASNNDVSYNVIANSVVRSNAEAWWGSGAVGTGNQLHDNCVWAANPQSSYNANGGVNLSGGGYTASANKTANPLFADASRADFSLSAGTGCAGYGVPAGTVPGPGSGSISPTPPSTTTSTTSPTPTSTAVTTTQTAPTTTTSTVTTTATTTGASTTPGPPPPASPGAPPTTTQPPSISGGEAVGETLTATSGTWVNASGYSMTWLRCRSAGDGCTPIAGANAPTYRLVSSDRRARIRVTVIAENPVGSTTATSTATGRIKR